MWSLSLKVNLKTVYENVIPDHLVVYLQYTDGDAVLKLSRSLLRLSE